MGGYWFFDVTDVTLCLAETGFFLRNLQGDPTIWVIGGP